MAFNNEINQNILTSPPTGSGSFVGSVSPALTGTPTVNAYALAPVTPWVAWTPTFTALGTVTSIAFWSRRVGDVLEVRGSWVAGTPTSSEARVSLGFNGVDGAVSASSTVLTATEVCGLSAYSRVTASATYVLIESGKAYMNFSLQNGPGGNASLTPISGTTLMFSGDTLSILAKIPVTTWP